MHLRNIELFNLKHKEQNEPRAGEYQQGVGGYAKSAYQWSPCKLRNRKVVVVSPQLSQRWGH